MNADNYTLGEACPIPNLDAEGSDALAAYRDQYLDPTLALTYAIGQLLPAARPDEVESERDRRAVQFMREILAPYCQARIHAITARLAGRIPEAIGHERHAENLYRAMPEGVRW